MRNIDSVCRNIALVTISALAVSYRGVEAQVRSEQGEVNLDVTVHVDQSMSGPEQRSWIESEVGDAKGVSRKVQNLLDQARKEKDTLKITCLDDKLTQIHVNLRGIEERTAAHATAVQGGDNSIANQQFSILQIYISRIKGLMTEAENCIGDIDVVLGETETTVTVDEEITSEDPAGEKIDEEIGVEQPPHASGYF